MAQFFIFLERNRMRVDLPVPARPVTNIAGQSFSIASRMKRYSGITSTGAVLLGEAQALVKCGVCGDNCRSILARSTACGASTFSTFLARLFIPDQLFIFFLKFAMEPICRLYTKGCNEANCPMELLFMREYR